MHRLELPGQLAGMQHAPPVYGPIGGVETPQIRVDWKAGFSAERTFMAWVHMVITLTIAALPLVASEGTRTTGFLLIVPAGIFLLWAATSFYRRAAALSQKTVPGLEDRTVSLQQQPTALLPPTRPSPTQPPVSQPAGMPQALLSSHVLHPCSAGGGVTCFPLHVLIGPHTCAHRDDSRHLHQCVQRLDAASRVI